MCTTRHAIVVTRGRVHAAERAEILDDECAPSPHVSANLSLPAGAPTSTARTGSHGTRRR